ncbi:hypothetical protein [Sphingomonas sp. DBB INV C78]|uniref:hypothetical protein n=1 Tax=Sphingomonas sp. DBB INV C78 TaxID=3349434 RepID=UPI0036D2D1CE
MRRLVLLAAILGAVPALAQDQQKILTAGDVAGSAVGTVGERQSAAQIANINPTARIDSRISNRVQNRIHSRMDRNYDPKANPASSVEAAIDKTRVAAPR